MQTNGIHSDTKPDNFPPDDYIEKLEKRLQKLEDQNYKILERFSYMTSQLITNEYAIDDYMDEEMKNMKKIPHTGDTESLDRCG